MKINYLLYSVAFASAFAACSDELTEVANAPVNDALAGRPVVGNVALSVSKAGESATRLNDNGTAFKEGDQIKLFLMDEFMLGTEEWNANMTDFKSQDVWFNMYNMVDYIHTNYIYDYNGTDFINKSAQLVEGNYFAFYQEDESYRTHEITNRQDLWAYINPTMVLDPLTENTYMNRENDIYLDYQQFYRDEDADLETGVLKKDMMMKPVLNRVKFRIGNLNNAPYLIKRIVIKKTNMEAVPTLAYVRPYAPSISARPNATYVVTDWNNEVMNDDANYGTFDDYKTALEALTDETEKELKLAAFNKKFKKHEVYDNFAGTTVTYYTYKGGDEAFTQEDARNITYFETPANGRIPYGLDKEDAAPAFEYVIEFPDGGHKLNAHAPYTKTEYVDAIVALPVFADDFNATSGYEIHVDGAYLDITKGVASNPGHDADGNEIWVPGYWDATSPSGYPNTKWKMDKAFDHDWTSALGKNFPEGTLTIDFNDMHLYEEEVAAGVTVSSTAELLEALQASALEGSNIANIELNGIGIEFTQEIADQIAANAAAYKLAHPSATPQYSVNFTMNAAYTVDGAQFDNTTTTKTYGQSDDADSWSDEDGNFNFNNVLYVTAKNVFDLPTNIYEVSATYAADQTFKQDVSFGSMVEKVVVESGVTFTVEDGVTVEFPASYVIFTNGTTIELKGTAFLDDAYIIPGAAVEVKGTGKIEGQNYGLVSLPAQNIKQDNLDGTFTELGFDDVIDHSGLMYNTGSVKLFKAANRKASEVGTTATYSGNDTTKDYELVEGATDVTVAKNIELFSEKK